MEISQTQVHTAPRLTSSNLYQRETENVLELQWTCDGVSILQFSARVKEKNTSVNSKLQKPVMDTQAKLVDDLNSPKSVYPVTPASCHAYNVTQRLRILIEDSVLWILCIS